MNIEELRIKCLSIKGASECFPFDEHVLVFKVMDKMFAYTDLNNKTGDFSVNLKCDPEKAISMRELYNGVLPGYHANKKYWNTVYIKSDVPDNIIAELIDHSVIEVVKKLSKAKQNIYFNS